MTHTGKPKTGRRAALALAAALVACALAPAAARSQGTPPADAGLTWRLAELSGPGLRDAPRGVQADVLSLPAQGPGSLLRSGGRVFVEVRFGSGALAAADDLRRAGAVVLDSSRRHQAVTVASRPAGLRALTRVPGVEIVSEVLTPVTRAACQGSVTSEGDAQLQAAAAREDFGVDGAGVTVGILSDSFNKDPGAATNAGDDVESGDLPGPGSPCEHTAPVDVLDDFLSPAEATDEGRGMAQIVHDLAPGAKISFATAFRSESSFAGNIRALAGAGASVIVDDVAWFEEPFFQDGPVAVAIGDVVGAGATYLTAAGNDNLLEGTNEISSWEAPAFRDQAGSCPAQLETGTEGNAVNCMDFDPEPGAGNVDDTFGITVEEDDELIVDLQWAEPWEGVDADIDAYLLDESGKPLEEENSKGEPVPVGSYGNNLAPANQRPVEVFGWENDGPETTVQLAIDLCFDTCNEDATTTEKPRLKFILLQNGGGVSAVEYPQSDDGDVVGPSVYGHAGSAAAISVGAIPFNSTTTPEAYSSRGPVTHYFEAVRPAGDGPAAAISPQLIPKPEVAATDCGRTTFFAPSSFRFCGTSAAAPHAAAVVALAREANSTLTPAAITQGLRDTAVPLAPVFDDAVGAGLVDAHKMIEEVALPPKITITTPPSPISKERSPSIAFEANRPVTFRCELDGSAPFPCSSPFVPEKPLADGTHGFVVSGIDLAGHRGAAPLTSFTVDTVAPRTSFAAHPRKTIRTRKRRTKAAFRFRSSEPVNFFTCRIDGGLFRICPAKITRRFGPGRHAIRVKAVDLARNVDLSAAVFRFEVKRIGR